MVCVDCRRAGEVASVNRSAAEELHGKCRGKTWCDCQHVVLERSPEPVADRVDC